jgi:hypothetical protein
MPEGLQTEVHSPGKPAEPSMNRAAVATLGDHYGSIGLNSDRS